MMNYCVECGTKLEKRYLENEGDIPYCPKCGQFRFPIFNTAVSMVTIDEEAEKILLIQQYGKPFYILVAGYVNRGEAAEHAAYREVLEETGLHVHRLEFNKSRFFEPSNTLMVNFAAFVDHEQVKKTDEVDKWTWFTFDEARENIKPGSLAAEFLNHYLDKREAEEN